MTDHFPLPDDELASAYLDGAVDDDERARVENDPDLLARADRLAGIRRAVAATAPVADSAQRDRHIANALEMLGAVAPISLADRRNRRLGRQLAVLGAAAAIVVVAGVLAVTANRQEHSSLSATAGQSAVTTTVPAAEASGGSSKNDSAAQVPAATAAAGATTTAAAAYSTTAAAVSAPAAPDLGPIDAHSAPSVLSDAGNRTGDFAVRPPACVAPPGTRYVGSATYSGTPVFAFVTEPGAAEQRGVLLDTTTCAVVADLRLT